jgi:hypothetical protein
VKFIHVLFALGLLSSFCHIINDKEIFNFSFKAALVVFADETLASLILLFLGAGVIIILCIYVLLTILDLIGLMPEIKEEIQEDYSI